MCVYVRKLLINKMSNGENNSSTTNTTSNTTTNSDDNNRSQQLQHADARIVTGRYSSTMNDRIMFVAPNPRRTRKVLLHSGTVDSDRYVTAGPSTSTRQHQQQLLQQQHNVSATSENYVLPSRQSTQQEKKTPVNKRKIRKPTRILREIRHLQNSTQLLIPRRPFHRLIKEIFNPNFRLTARALDALHEATETYMVKLFEDSYLLTLHRQRITLQSTDIRLILRLRGPMDPGN